MDISGTPKPPFCAWGGSSLKRRTTLAPSYWSTIVGPGVIAGSFPPRLKPQIVWSGMFGSDVMRKRLFSLARLMKKSSGGNRLKNWKQSVPGRRTPLYWPRPSKGRPVAGLMALFGHSCGAGVRSVTGRDGRMGGMRKGSMKGVVGGLHPG